MVNSKHVVCIKRMYNVQMIVEVSTQNSTSSSLCRLPSTTSEHQDCSVFIGLIYSFQMLEMVIKLNCMMIKAICVQETTFYYHSVELCDKWSFYTVYSVLITYYYYYYYYHCSSWFEYVESTMSLTYDYDDNFAIKLRINTKPFVLKFRIGCWMLDATPFADHLHLFRF